MSDPQIWTLIGVFAAAMLGGLTLVVTLLTRVLDSRFGELVGRFDAKFDAMDAKFDAIDAKFDALESKLTVRLDHLDRDIQALTARVWGTDRE